MGMAWIITVADILSIVLRYVIPTIVGGMAIWWLWNAGQAIQQGIQAAAPGVGLALSSVGMMISLMPFMMMYMMMFSMMTTMFKVFE